MKAKPAKSSTKHKPAAAKPKAKKVPVASKSKSGASSSGLLSKLKGALAPRKPAPAAKPAPAKSGTADKPGASARNPAKAVAAKVAPSSKPVATKPVSRSGDGSFKGLLTEEQIRRMHERDYMNDAQLDFFRQRLLQMREEVLARELDVKERLHQREIFADPADRATAEEEHWLDLRLRERESLLLRKIDDALRRIENREYGYCEKTGDPIGIPRLLARPTATVCVDVKGQDERVEAQFRDR